MNFNQWISCPKPNAHARLRIFCFPYSGAAASIYYPWSDGLPLNVEVCPVQLPGRGTRVAEELLTSLSDLVQVAAVGLFPYLDKPFAFFGHSLGALLSFELARFLKRSKGTGPIHLFVSGHNAPQILEYETPIHKLPEQEFVRELRELNGMSKEVLENDELMQLLIPILRADFQICESYVYMPGDHLDCPITAFGGLKDRYLSREGLEAWCKQTNASISVRMFPGDHFFLNSDRQLLLHTLARDLSQYL